MSRKKRIALSAKNPRDNTADNNAISAQIARILDSQIDLSRKDVKAWREALEACIDKRNPIRYELYDMYDNYAIDPYLQGQIQMLISAIQSTPFILQDKEGNRIEDYDAIFQSSTFFEIVRDVVLSDFYGYTLLEFLEVSDKKITYSKIPHRNIIPIKGMILINPSIPSSGVAYTDMDNILPIGRVEDIGILNNIIPHLIWKRHAEQAWSGFMERFGTPLITAETSKTQKRDLDFIDSKLREMGQNLTAVLPINTKLNILQPSNTDAFRVFDERIKQCNQQMAVMITLSSTLSDVSANRSQSEVHERNFNEKVVGSRMRMVSFWVNDTFIPMLRKKGINITEGSRFVFDSSYELSNQELQTMTLGLMQRYTIDPEWITKTFGIPVTPPSTATPSLSSLSHPATIHACCPPSMQLSVGNNDKKKVSKRSLT